MRQEIDFVESPIRSPARGHAQHSNFPHQIYNEKIGHRLLFWRIAPRKYFGPVLEWFVYDETDRRAVSLRRETDVRKVASMERLQRPERNVAMDDIPDALLDQLIAWNWVQAG